MRGLTKTAPDGADTQTDGHGDSMTNLAQRGRVGENPQKKLRRLVFDQRSPVHPVSESRGSRTSVTEEQTKNAFIHKRG